MYIIGLHFLFCSLHPPITSVGAIAAHADDAKRGSECPPSHAAQFIVLPRCMLRGLVPMSPQSHEAELCIQLGLLGKTAEAKVFVANDARISGAASPSSSQKATLSGSTTFPVPIATRYSRLSALMSPRFYKLAEHRAGAACSFRCC